MNIKKMTPLHQAKNMFALMVLAFVCLSLFSNLASAETTKRTTTYYHVNLQGTPIAASDENGVQKWSQSYSSYGYHKENTSQINDKGPTSFGFGAHVEDQYEDKLLVYMQGRYYDPALGRFLSVDPVGFNESNPASFNRYIYGNNNPNKYIDPNGELPILLVYWGVTAALTAYDTYSAYQEGGAKGAIKQVGTDIVLGAVGGGLVSKFAVRGGKLFSGVTGVAKGRGKTDFIVSSNSTATHASQSKLKDSLVGAGAKSKGPTTQTSEAGEIFNMNTANGSMDIRIMSGKSGGGANSGPRTITTRPGTKDYVHPNGQRITGAVSKSDRRAIGHTHGQRP